MLRDDKSYVYIFVSADKPYPRIASGRGKGKHQVGKFFGPYPSAYNARILCWFCKSCLMFASVKIAIFHSVSVLVCSIKSNVVQRRV